MRTELPIRRSSHAIARALLLAGALALSWTRPWGLALAQPAEREAEAKAYFLSGVELLNAGKIEAALEQFQRSRAAFPRGKNTINAAICLERLGRFDEALALYEELRDQRAAELEPSERAKLAPIIKSLSAKVGRVSVVANVPAAVVQIDGKPRGSAASPLRVLPGRHVLRVIAPGHTTFTAPIEVRAGDDLKLDARLEPLERVGVLRIEDPEGGGADVFVDQVLVGQTPWEGVVATGPHVVILRQATRGSKPSAVTVVEGQTALVRVETFDLGPSVSLRVEPPSAGLSLDGVLLANGSWEGRLPRGRYRVRAEEPGYVAREAELVLAERPENLRLDLVIDPEHPRWPKTASGDFLLGVVGGLSVGGGLGSGAELFCPDHCSENNPAVGYFVAARVGYRFPVGTAIEATGGYAAATTSVLREVTDSFSAAGSSQTIRYQLSEVVDLSFPFVGLGVSQAVRLTGPLSLVGRVTGGVAFARASTALQANARTTGPSVEAFVDRNDEPSGPLPFLQPELGVELALGQVRLSGGVGAWGLLGLTPAYGDRALVVRPAPSPSDPTAVGNAPYSDAVAGERSAGLTWLVTPQVAAGYAF